MRLVRLPILLSFASLSAAGLYIAESVPTSNEALAGDYITSIQTETHGNYTGKRTGKSHVTEATVVANQLRSFLEAGGTRPAGPEVEVAQAEINIVTSDKSDRADIIQPAGATPDGQADPADDDLESDETLADDGAGDLTEDEGDLLADDGELDQEELDLDEVELAEDESSDGELDEAELDEEELDGEGDLLDAAIDEDEDEDKPETQEASVETDEDGEVLSADEEHLNLFLENRYPSATTCGTCHPKHFAEWSVSQHAYAQLSPVYLSLNNRINELSNGSNGDFCFR